MGREYAYVIFTLLAKEALAAYGWREHVTIIRDLLRAVAGMKDLRETHSQ